MKHERVSLRRRIGYTAPLAILSLAVACSGTAQESSGGASQPPTAESDAPNGWANQPKSDERAIDCSGSGQHGTEKDTFAFVIHGEHDTQQVIGRLTVAVDPENPSDIVGENDLDTTWTFPPNQERMYSYGIRDIPTVHVGSETYEMSVGPEDGGYYAYCGRRNEPWPAPDLKPTF